MSHSKSSQPGARRPLDAATASRIAETMQALAAPTRVRILSELRERALAVGELAETVGMTQSAVSHQLRLLRYLGLVVGERHGRTIVYSLHDSHVGALLDEAVYHVEHIRLGISATSTTEAAS